jgi:predicted ABC-type ATPase
MEENKNTFVIFAGPNGSGKSTVVKAYRKIYPDLDYIGADYIEKTLYSDLPPSEDRSRLALLKAEETLALAIGENSFCGYETVLSSDHKWKFFKQAKDRGMRITAIYIATEDPKINCARVKKRVEGGSHDVPPDKIIKRYYDSLKRLPKLLSYSNIAFIYDNSRDGEPPLLLISKEGDTYYFADTIKDEHQWLNLCMDEISKNDSVQIIQKTEKEMQSYHY